ncbi:type IV toxin-antitoxin system AbiEi family antitoxin [Lentzea sp. BCCO 10_0856]|uniref:Type IV toxin-antitoxin system AbiEi family antitoxin n=1 Tax=Lentzea miocenica TaxID=3095431 RepID=A0ABU4TED5_9PSEU|nr:type IV toxin-antitoxin system AbiEi family antitoxin [Lentzea sp. BCCO 10_0856]MDX8036555.1 type IV toxin-antitoxin system AbiEi family antitoxin [Lentzea sp. BCCO 10_0856]
MIAAPDGVETWVLVEGKGVVVPRDVTRVAQQLAEYAAAAAVRGVQVGGMMLATPFVSPTTRAQLDQHGLGWFDLTGNLRLRLDRPAVFLDRVGADRSGFRDPADRLLKSLRGPAAAKVVLELCETSLPVGVRDLAARAQVGAATSVRVLELLDREATIVRSQDGTVVAVRKRSLIDRWTQDYKVMASNEIVAALDPRGLSHAMKALSTVEARVVVTGSAAARAYLPDDMTPVSPLVSLSLYTEDPLELMDRLGLKTVERGTNVLVLRPYDEVVHVKSRHINGIDYAAPAQVVADLLTGPGRSSEEAEQLIAVLESSEPGWDR